MDNHEIAVAEKKNIWGRDLATSFLAVEGAQTDKPKVHALGVD
jgi:hypothetical protein